MKQLLAVLGVAVETKRGASNIQQGTRWKCSFGNKFCLCRILFQLLEDNASAEEKGTSLISDLFSVGGVPFQDQAQDIASPKEEEERKRKRTQLVDPSPPQNFETYCKQNKLRFCNDKHTP
ncbi:hypothetical protein SLE2022_060400 [Rubroshorea leprosula]